MAKTVRVYLRDQSPPVVFDNVYNAWAKEGFQYISQSRKITSYPFDVIQSVTEEEEGERNYG
jgi:hypothetical protein